MLRMPRWSVRIFRNGRIAKKISKDWKSRIAKTGFRGRLRLIELLYICKQNAAANMKQYGLVII